MENSPSPSVLNILIVDDEEAHRETVRKALESHGTFQISTAANGAEVFQRLNQQIPDLLILDLGLPDCDGMDVCRRLKEEERFRWIPIIMITGRSTISDKITGLEVGADDYLTKPFDPRELIARLQAVLRRKKALGPLIDYDVNGLRISAARRQVWINGSAIAITPKEFDLLMMIVSKRGALVSREEIGRVIWAQSADESAATLDTHIWRLRSKLRECGERIQTVGKNGYRLVD